MPKDRSCPIRQEAHHIQSTRDRPGRLQHIRRSISTAASIGGAGGGARRSELTKWLLGKGAAVHAVSLLRLLSRDFK
ncbi:hypothetical protein AAHA92_22469 [Salvia divinorum]|uniref:Uncharacterized protein n=1 Tax=Salvia divinorum TaxID=28513 RepID=A0ABD1GNT9_SALDI